MRLYGYGESGVHVVALRDLAPGGVQMLRIGPAVSDRFELAFTDPVSDTPGYTEVIVGWDSAPSRHVVS